jgi:hypothetical protein
MYFNRGSLPWQGLRANTKKQKYEKIMEKKMTTPIDVLCKGFPAEFHTYFEYCRSLRFEDKPDYAYLKRLFKELFFCEGYQLDGQFDWTKLNQQDRAARARVPRGLGDGKDEARRDRKDRDHKERAGAGASGDKEGGGKASKSKDRGESGRDGARLASRSSSAAAGGSRERRISSSGKAKGKSSGSGQAGRSHTSTGHRGSRDGARAPAYPAPRIATTSRTAGHGNGERTGSGAGGRIPSRSSKSRGGGVHF